MKKKILFIILVLTFGYFIVIPFVINQILIPIQNYQTSSVYKNVISKETTDEDFTYYDELGNKIIIWDFKKNVPNIGKSFFEENLSGELFKELSDSINDKFEFKIIEFNKIDSLKYKIRVRKAKIQKKDEINLNNRKYINYILELERLSNLLTIKKCSLLNIEVD